MKTLTLSKFDCDYILHYWRSNKIKRTVFIRRHKITESDVEDANESHQAIASDGVYDEDIDIE